MIIIVILIIVIIIIIIYIYIYIYIYIEGEGGLCFGLRMRWRFEDTQRAMFASRPWRSRRSNQVGNSKMKMTKLHGLLIGWRFENLIFKLPTWLLRRQRGHMSVIEYSII